MLRLRCRTRREPFSLETSIPCPPRSRSPLATSCDLAVRSSFPSTRNGSIPLRLTVASVFHRYGGRSAIYPAIRPRSSLRADSKLSTPPRKSTSAVKPPRGARESSNPGTTRDALRTRLEKLPDDAISRVNCPPGDSPETCLISERSRPLASSSAEYVLSNPIQPDAFTTPLPL